jgi:hypothetical protein
MGQIQAAQDLLATTLADSATFRTFANGAATRAAALARIHHDYIPDKENGVDAYTPEELSAIRPCALIFTVPDAGYHYDRDAAGTNNWAARGELVCVLTRDHPVETVDGQERPVESSTADVAMREIAGGIISDLVEMSEDSSGDYLAATGFTCSGPYRTAPEDIDELGERQAFEIHIRWGNR